MHTRATHPDVEKRPRLIVVALNAIQFSRFDSFAFFSTVSIHNRAALQLNGRILV